MGVAYTLDVEQIDGVWMGFVAARRYEKMRAAALREAGISLRVNSGFRTMDEQTELYHLTPEEKAARGVGGTVAAPGFSVHQTGNALDIGPPEARPWLKVNASRFGFAGTVPSEPWHFETIG